MRCAAITLTASLAGTLLAHPGNGIVATSADSVITGDAVGNGIWTFRKGQSPERKVQGFHCHWVTRGADGKIYAENLHETGGVWESGIYLLDSTGAKPELVLRQKELTSLVFAASRDGFIYQAESTLVARFSNGRGNRAWFGNVKDVSAYAWNARGTVLWIADGKSIRSGALGDRSLRTGYQVTGTVNNPLYAGPSRELKIWGIAVSPRSEIYAAVPAMSSVIRFDRLGQQKTVYTGKGGWQPVGVDALGSDIFVLESKTAGNQNLGPRVTVIRADGRIDSLGEVKR